MCTTRILTENNAHTMWYPNSWVFSYIQSRSLAPDANKNYLLRTIRRITDEFVMQYPGGEEHDRKLSISLSLSIAACLHLRKYATLAVTKRDMSRVGSPSRSNLDYIWSLRVHNFLMSMSGVGQTSDASEHLLSAAAYIGDMSTVGRLLAEGIDVNEGSNVFGKPLWAAACNGQHEIVRCLLIKGADANYGVYPRTEDDQRVVEVNNSKEDIERVRGGDSWGNTALAAAALGGHKEVVQLLLQPEFKVSRSDYSYRQAILDAAEAGDASIMQLLLDSRDRSAIQENFIYKDFESALVLASHYGKVEVINLMLDKGIHVDVTDTTCTLLDRWNTPIEHAAFNGHYDAVQLLMKRGASIHALGSNTSPTISAAGRGFLRVVELLLDQGAEEGRDAFPLPDCLERAAAYGQIHVVRFLLERGMLEVTRYGGEIALGLAMDWGYDDVTALLMAYGATPS